MAATAGPGLALCLNVGLTAGKELAQKLDVPFMAINHLEAHALAPRLENDGIRFPHIVLLVSGGHCCLLLAKAVGEYLRLGSTLDDSIGEAFDKVARMLGMPFAATTEVDGIGSSPGARLENLARAGDPLSLPFPVPMRHKRSCDFSFSGLKTAVKYFVKNNAAGSDSVDDCDIAASFQHAAFTHLEDRLKVALRWCKQAQRADMIEELPSCVVVSGGVAANSALRTRLTALGESHGLPIHFPSQRLCADNGVMIAWAAVERLKAGFPTDSPLPSPAGPNFRARWPLGVDVSKDVFDGGKQVRFK